MEASRTKCVDGLNDLEIVDSEEDTIDGSIQNNEQNFEQSSILCIEDLPLDEETDAKPIPHRTDLIQMQPDNCNIVLDLLMKRAFDVVTDEASRWTPDADTAN